jgi:putative ABC transport system permease protein
VVALLTPAVAGTGLEVSPVKADALTQADDTGTSLSTAFLLMAQFSVAAGVLLIFLIFVMLAAERKHELGIARAVGAQRGHVIRMFTFEGALYAVMAAALGSLLGVGVGYAMVFVLRTAFASSADAGDSLELAFAFNAKSVVLAYMMGVVLTLLVVVFSSWRVSRLNIVRAVRDIPEPRVQHRGWFRTVLWVLVPVAGLLLAAAGLQGNQLGPFMLGTSLVIIGLLLLARRFGLPDRIAFTAAGVGLLVWWLLPSFYPSFYEDWLPEMTQGMEMFFLSGIMLVIGAVWVVVYNSDLLLALVVAVFGRIPGAPPVLKTAVSYPMASRFRTGMTLAMFSLVVFTLVVMSFIINGNRQVFSNEEALSGGYQVRAQTSVLNPVGDLRAQLAGPAPADPAAGPGATTPTEPSSQPVVSPADIVASGALSVVPVEGRPAGSMGTPGEFLLQGADEAYTESAGYGFTLRAEQYGSGRQVWRALQDEPDTVVVSAATVPSQANYSLNAPDPPFMFSGVYLQDTQLPDLRLSVRDPASGNTRDLKVIGVLDPISIYTGTAMVSQQTLDDVMGKPIAATSHWLTLADGRDPELVAQALERRFLANGLQAVDTAGEIRQFSSTNLMVNNLLQGFMALGLVVGVAALGVIAARSVVERRQQIGVLRAIGFQKGMVRNSFLLESSFIALLGIGTGLALGLALTPQIMDIMAEAYAGESSVRTIVPWQSLLIVSAVAYTSALLTTILPARQASSVTPAEALRYE